MKTTKIISLFLVLALCLSAVMLCVGTFADVETESTTTKDSYIFAPEDKISAMTEQTQCEDTDSHIEKNISTKDATNSGTTAEGLTYSIIDNSYAEITGYTGSSSEIVIPSEINGYPVKGVGESAFYDSSLTIVSICDGVEYIGESAFHFSTLKSIEIPNTVTVIGAYAFEETDLKDITIPNSVKEIGDSAFGCSITNISIPDSVEHMDYAFAHSSSLVNIEVSKNNPNYCDVEGVLFNKSKTTVVRYPAGRQNESYKIPEGVTTINGGAFSFADSLENIEIPDTVTSVGGEAFGWCMSLQNIKIPDGVTEIEAGLFYDCDSLKNIEIPNGVKSVGGESFAECSSLISIKIPNGVTEIGYSAFQGCDSLESVAVPHSVTKIGEYAFDGCDNLTVYGESGSYAETYASEWNIPFIDIDSSATDENISSVFNDFEYQILDNSYAKITNYIGTATEVVIPSEIDGYPVKSIGYSAFNRSTYLKNVTIGNNVTNIGKSAFSECYYLTSVTIEDGVMSIDDWAFAGCELLTVIEISNSVTSIGEHAFAGCDKLTIYGKSRSYAEEYAKENDITFIAINESTARPTPNTTVTPNTTAKPTEKPGVPKTGSTKLAVVIASILVIAAVGTTTGVLIKKED